MDKKHLKSYDKEFMKMCMLKHEEIFRQQVHELHRLYQTQKLLMNGMETSSTQQPSRQQNISGISRNDHISGSYTSHQRQEEKHIADSNGQELGLIQESEIQLTLGPSTYKTNHHHNPSSSGQSFSSSNSTESSQNPDTKAPTREDFVWEFTRSSRKGVQMSLGEEHLRQDRMKQHPPWMFQALSLKLT